MELLKTLCKIEAPSGSEKNMTEFVLDYIKFASTSCNIRFAFLLT